LLKSFFCNRRRFRRVGQGDLDHRPRPAAMRRAKAVDHTKPTKELIDSSVKVPSQKLNSWNTRPK
jgi:hypothetical protein